MYTSLSAWQKVMKPSGGTDAFFESKFAAGDDLFSKQQTNEAATFISYHVYSAS